MLKLKKLTETYGMKVFTEEGEYFGDIDEVVIQNNKLFGWKVKATRDSFLSKTVSGAKGVIIPQQLVKAVGDVMIISKAAIPSGGEEEKAEKEEA